MQDESRRDLGLSGHDRGSITTMAQFGAGCSLQSQEQNCWMEGEYIQGRDLHRRYAIEKSIYATFIRCDGGLLYSLFYAVLAEERLWLY